jgi:hypothetical protein
MSDDIFRPLILELEELAQQHPDPKVRADIMHVIDMLHGTCDQNLMEVMHQFYHLREQLREQREIERLTNKFEGHETQVIPFDFSEQWNEIPDPPSNILPDAFQEVMDEIEVDEMILAHKRWHVTIGEA